VESIKLLFNAKSMFKEKFGIHQNLKV